MQDPTSLPPALASALRRIDFNLEQVERSMRDQLVSVQPVVGAIGEHVLGSGGKRLRPALLMWTAALCGYEGPRCVQVAAAVELLHTATLLHDDVVDLAETRRSKEAARIIWGNRRAVLVGDFFYARASSMIVEDGDPDILQVFSDSIRRMAEGELMQLEKSFDPGVSEAHYFAVIGRKSASLMTAATETGAILGGVTRAERRRLADFGHEFGITFQLRDDALDYSADAEVLGKSPFTDLREGKVTLPLLLALKRCTEAERNAVSDILKTAARRAREQGAEGVHASDALLEEGELSLVQGLVERYRGVADTDRRAALHAERAAEAIAPFPDSLSKDALLAAADYAAGRAR